MEFKRCLLCGDLNVLENDEICFSCEDAMEYFEEEYYFDKFSEVAKDEINGGYMQI